MNRLWILIVVPVLFVLGCSDGTLAPAPVATGDDMTEQMAEIAIDSVAMLDADLDDSHVLVAAAHDGTEGVSSEITITFSKTRACPGGGDVVVDGTLRRTYDGATRTMEAHLEGTRTMTDCVFFMGDLEITVNSHSELEAFRRRVGGKPDGPQTTHFAGEFHAVRSDGEEKSCSWDVTVVREGGEVTRTAEGEICGVPFERRAEPI